MLEGVAVHRVAHPDHGVAGELHRPQERRQGLGDGVGAHAADEHEAPGLARRIEAIAERDDVFRRRRRPELHADRVLDPAEELDVRAAELTRALADPQQVRGAVVPLVGEAVAPGERLLVAEQQRLVRRVEVDLVELVLCVQVDAARGHEPERAVDLSGEQRRSGAPRGWRRRTRGSTRDTREVGEPTLGERPQQVEGGRGLMVRAHEPLGIGPAGRGLEREVVDHVAAERRQLDVAALSRWARSAAWRTARRSDRS